MRKNYDLEVLNYELRASTVSPRLSEKYSPEVRHENSRPTYLSTKDSEVIKYELLASARSMSPRASVPAQSQIQSASLSNSLFNESRSEPGTRKPLNELHESIVASRLSEKFATDVHHENSLQSPQSITHMDGSSLELLASAPSLSPKSTIPTKVKNDVTRISSALLNKSGPKYSPEHMGTLPARNSALDLRSSSVSALPLEKLHAIALPSPPSSKDFEVIRYEMLALARLKSPRTSTHLKSREVCYDYKHDLGNAASPPKKSLPDFLDLNVGLREIKEQEIATVRVVESLSSDCHGQLILCIIWSRE
jgi:hypothetical protein